MNEIETFIKLKYSTNRITTEFLESLPNEVFREWFLLKRPSWTAVNPLASKPSMIRSIDRYFKIFYADKIPQEDLDGLHVLLIDYYERNPDIC